MEVVGLRINDPYSRISRKAHQKPLAGKADGGYSSSRDWEYKLKNKWGDPELFGFSIVKSIAHTDAQAHRQT